MTKNVLTKMRSWDENIGKLIVFAVTIIIAVGVLGTLAYFYNQSRDNAVMKSLITSTATKWADLETKGLCSGTTVGYVTYSAIANKYTLNCAAGTVGCTKLKWIWGVILSWTCTSTSTTWISYSIASTK